jgi:hypothetical protein
MVRILIAIAGLWIVSCGVHAAEIASGHEATISIDLSYVNVSGLTSWTDGSVGKLRFSDDGLVMSRMFINYSGRISDTLNANIVLDAYDDDIGNAIDFTQAFLEWRPVPTSATRYRVKLGAFYPRISLENVDAGWSSPYTMSSSAINTWIAEEIRTFGAELSISRKPESLGGAHTFSFDVAAFWGNDPAGSLLAWRGWSVHDRQTRFNDQLPLPPLPQIQPGMMFDQQDPYVEPFKEIDGRAGYYATGEWRYGEKFLLRAGHYDNRADPTIIKDGQYAWKTVFEHVGVQTTLPGDIGFIAQWMFGTTVMGPVLYANGVHAVDVEYDSAFMLLTRAFGDHRVSVRYDNFDVTQNDQTPEDSNPDSGHAWTLAYQLGLTEYLSVAAEWLSIKTHHCGWAYYDLSPTATETQFSLSLKLRL